MTHIYLSPPDIGQAEKVALNQAIDSGFVSSYGPELFSFEDDLKRICQRDYAIAVSSGTAALHLSLIGLGVKNGDYVLCSTMTFVATANAILYLGAIPVFIDSEPESGNMSPVHLRDAIDALLGEGREIAAVMVVDLLGKVADYPSISAVCERYGIPIVSDAAESLGASRNGRPAGSFASIAAISFNGNKIATTSGGGVVLTNNPEIAEKVRYLANQAKDDAIHYQHSSVGFNYRLSNLAAALGRAQLARLEEIKGRRRIIREKYKALLSLTDQIEVFGQPDEEDNCWLTSVVIPSSASRTSLELLSFLARHEIESRPLWKPMHLQPLFHTARFFGDTTSEYLFRRGLALPSGSGMSLEEWNRVSSALLSFLSEGS